jgi:hypothetical protein
MAQRAQRAMPLPREQQIAQIKEQAEEAATITLAEQLEARTALTDHLEVQTQEGEDARSPVPAWLHEQTRSSAPGGTDAPDGSAG